MDELTVKKLIQEALEASQDAHLKTDIAREAQMLKVFTEALHDTFSIEDSNGQKRFLDITRVPLICQSIIGIDGTLKDIKSNMVTKEAFWPVKTLVYGAVGIILVSVMTALVYLVLNK